MFTLHTCVKFSVKKKLSSIGLIGKNTAGNETVYCRA